MRGSWPWRAAIVVGAVVLAVTGLRVGLEPDRKPDRLPDRLPRPAETTAPPVAFEPLKSWKIRTAGFRTEGVSSAPGYLFPVADPLALAKPIVSPDGVHDPAVISQWVQANGGVDARWTTVRLTIGATRGRIVLRDLRVVGLLCTQPTTPRLRVDVPPDRSSRNPARRMRVRLDRDATEVGRSWSFPLTVPRGRTEVIEVQAGVTRRECEWKLRFEYSVDGVAGHVEIMNGGQSFVTAPGPGDGRPDWTSNDALAFRRERFPG